MKPRVYAACRDRDPGDWSKVTQPEAGSDLRWPDSQGLSLANSQVAASGVGGAGRRRLGASVLERLTGARCHPGD